MMTTRSSAEVQQHGEIGEDDDRNERPQQEQELALVEQIGLAGLPDQLRNLEHRSMRGQAFQVNVHEEAENHAQNTGQRPEHEQAVAVHAEEVNLSQIRKLQIGFPADRFVSRKSRALTEQGECGKDAGESGPA